MKKYLITASLLCTAAITGTLAYRNSKKRRKDNIMFYPMGRYVIHSDENLLSIKELVSDSDLVIYGRVTGKTSPKWNNKDNIQPKNVNIKDLVYFDYEISPIEIIKGQLNTQTEVRIRSFEGFVGGYSVEDNSQPRLEENQEIIALLKAGNKKDCKPDEKNFYVLTGALQGIFIEEQGVFKNMVGEFSKMELIDLLKQLTIK